MGRHDHPVRQCGAGVSRAGQQRFHRLGGATAGAGRPGGFRGGQRRGRERLSTRPRESTPFRSHVGCHRHGRNAAAGIGGHPHAANRHRADASALRIVSGDRRHETGDMADAGAFGPRPGRTGAQCMGSNPPTQPRASSLQGRLCESSRRADLPDGRDGTHCSRTLSPRRPVHGRGHRPGAAG